MADFLAQEATGEGIARTKWSFQVKPDLGPLGDVPSCRQRLDEQTIDREISGVVERKRREIEFLVPPRQQTKMATTRANRTPMPTPATRRRAVRSAASKATLGVATTLVRGAESL